MVKKLSAVNKKSIEKIVDNLTLFDDDLMTEVFDKNIPATQLLLRIILDDSNIIVKSVKGQEYIKSPDIGGRELYLDIVAVDGNGRKFDVEVQRNVEGSHVKRARFHSSMIDSRMLKSGQKFRKLRDTYVIFICEFDKFKKGLPIYHVDRIISETGELFGDGSHIIYINGEYNGNDSIGYLMNDFRALKSTDIINMELAEGVRFYKETKEGRRIMCNAVEKYTKKATDSIRIETFKKCIAKGMSKKDAIDVSGVSEKMADKILASKLQMM